MVGGRRCGTPFFVCRKDYRGQAYCGDACRAAARVVSARAARIRHERSEAGRLDHRDRQRATRMRLRARVTDHTSAAMPLPRTLSPPRSTPAPQAPFHARLARCVRCGCESAWARWAPPPRTQPRRSRRDRGRERGKSLPRDVEEELRRYLRCGDPGARLSARRVPEVPSGNRRRVLVQVPRSVPLVLGPADVRRRSGPGGPCAARRKGPGIADFSGPSALLAPLRSVPRRCPMRAAPNVGACTKAA
jgi:hypothetical protein